MMTRNTAADYETLYASEYGPATLRALMGASVAPRPIALITTLGPGGVANAAPFANFMGVSTEPLLVAFALGRKKDEEKDTLRNVRDTGVFTVNVTTREMAAAMHHTAANYPRDRSEIAPAGLSTLPGDATDVPRIAESPIHLECRLYQLVEIGGPTPTNVLVLGEVLGIHARRDLVEDGPTIKEGGWNPLGGVGDGYAELGEVFHLPSPTPILE